jgi:hypothetical protein
MGIEVLILEKSTLSRRVPFDTLGIYARPFRETNKNQSLKTDDMKLAAFLQRLKTRKTESDSGHSRHLRHDAAKRASWHQTVTDAGKQMGENF